MIHGETVILEQTASQGHLVSSLNQGCTEIPPALVLALVKDVERRGEKLLSQLLSSR